MTIQIAVRLQDDLVEFIDQEIKDGKGTSRAAVVSKALERERRRAIAERDVKTLRGLKLRSPELEAVSEYARALPMDHLD